MARAGRSRLERGVPLVEKIVERLRPHVAVEGAPPGALDRLEDRLGVELPPTMRTFLGFDFRFASFGRRWRGRGRFGSGNVPRPRVASLRTLAEAMTDEGWSPTKVRGRLVRLPNLPREPWNALYLGEARRDGELPILGLVADGTAVMPFLRYTAFDLYLLEQSGLATLDEATRLDDVETHLLLNHELAALVPDEDFDPSF